MANYDAQINILVAGQRNIQNLANQLNAIEDSIGQIERRWRSATGALQRANIRLGVTGTQQPRGEGGRFARDPDRRARQLAFQDRRRALVDQRLARLAVSRERAQAVAARSSIDSNETLIRQTERRIVLESRLNSANELFQRRLQQLSRGGGGRGLPQELQDQARSIQSAYQAAGGAASRNVRLIQSLATELGRVVERQNEFNRLQALGSKGFEAGRRLQERITAASSIANLPSRRVRDVRRLATEVIAASRRGDQQAYSEALRGATAATSRLERDARELADAMREQEREIARIARIAPRSPVRGGRNFPGSPIAEEIALREAQKGFPALPIRGTVTMVGSPKAKEAQAKAEKVINEATGLLGGAAQRLIGVENKAELKLAIDEYLNGLDNIESGAEKILKKNAKSLKDFDQKLKNRETAKKSEKAIAEATGLAERAAQRLVGIENRTELASAIDEYLAGLNDVQLNAEKILKKNAKSLKDFDQRFKERGDFQKSQEKAIADAWKMRGGPALPAGFTEAGVVKQKGASVDIGAQRRLQSVLASGSIIEQGLINLREKGANVSSELVDLQQALNTAKQKDYVISENTLDVLSSQVSLAGKFAQLQRTILAGQGGGRRGSKAGAAVSLEKQRQAALEKILQVEEKIRSARRISAREAQDYYFQAGLSRLALPFGDVNLPQMRGGARSTGPSMIQGVATPRVREILGGGRTADEAQATLRLAQANTKLAQSVKGIDAEYNRFLPDTKMLNASARGIQRLTTDQDKFNEAVASGMRFQQKYNQEQERLRRIYGTPMPVGTAAPVKGAGATRPQTAEKIESTRRRLLDQALGVQRQFIILEKNGRDVAQDRADIDSYILNLKNKQNSSTQAENELLAQQIGLLRTAAKEEANRLAALPKTSGGKKTGPEGTGLEQALKRLEEARGARQKFLGDVSPAEAIDKIVREFNQGASTGGDQGAAQAAENVVGTYAQRITAGIPAVAGAMMKLGKAGIDAIKKALGIASPSKVMLAIAKNQIDTYVDFLRAAIPAVEAAAKAVGEAGAPKTSGVPESAIKRPITEKARTRPLSAQALAINSAIAEYAASQITGPTEQLEQVKRKIEDFIDKTRTSVDLDKLFGGQADERFAMARSGFSVGPEFDKLRAALADFYQIPAELTPGLERGTKAASDASASADELAKYVSELTSGVERIGVLLQSAAKLPTPSAKAPAVVDESFRQAQEAAAKADAAAAEAARKKAEAQKPFEASIQRAAELDAEAKRKADTAVSSVVQAQIEADAKAGAEAISKSILDPIESAAPEGERQVRSAVGSLFDRVAGALGFGGGGGGRPPVPPTGGGGPTRDPGDFNRRLSTAAEQGAEALLGLQELRDPTKATTLELEALSGVLKEFRKILDPTVEGFDRLEKQLRESAANLDRQLERRAPDASFLTRRFGPRTARGLSEGLIGGAFPLLFGQGLGAAVGGGAGGFAGGFAGGGLGFGLSLVGTALGTAFDTAVQGAQELGRALEKPVENFDQLAQQSFFSSKALEDTIKKTIEYGDTATASALIQEEAIKKLGVGGVQNLKVLGTESDRLNRAFAELGQQMQAVSAGPLASVIGFFANIAGQAAAAGRVRLLRSNLDEQQAGQFNQEILQRLQQQGIQRGFFAPSAPTDAEIGMLLERGALQDIVDKWQAIEVKGRVKLDPKQKIESEINALQKRLEAMDIGRSLLDQVRSVNREQEDLDKQRADLVRSYEESIGNIRKQVEGEIRNKRFATLEKENQLLDAQGQIRLKQLQIANQAAIAQAGVGQRPEVEQAAKEVAQLVAQFTEQQVSAEEEAASIKRNAALEVQKIDSEAAQFKANIEKEVSRLNIETARRVDDINLGVTRRNEEYDQNRFNLEKRIAELQLKLEEDKLKVQVRSSLAAGDSASFLLASGSLRLVQEAQKELAKQAAPSPLGGIPTGSIGGQGVPTTGLDRATADYRAAVENYVAAQLRLNELDVIKDAQEFALGIAELANKTDAALTAIQTREADAEIERLRYIELVNAGLTDTVAQKVIELENTKRVALAVYDTAIAQLQSKVVAEATTDQVKEQNKAYQDQIDILKKRKDALEGKFGEVDTATGKGTGAIGGAIESDRGKKIQDFIAQAKAELIDLESVAIRVSQGIGDALGNSIADGVNSMIDGTKTAQEVFADLLKNIANILLQESTRMIATYIAIGIARMFAFGGTPVSGGAGGAGASDLPTAITSVLPIAANGAYFANGIAAFAKGGMFTNSVVSSPTLFKFADGGVARMGVMGEAGPEAIMPLKRGPGGRLGVDASGSGGDNIAVTVNVDAKGSSVQGDDQRGNQLGRAISAAVQQELIRQKRPGGLLA